MLWKIALVCAALLVPTVVLGVGYWSGMTSQTSFAASEQSGVDYASPVIGLMASTVRLRSANVRLALGDQSQSAAASAARAEIAEQVRSLDSVVADNPGGFGLGSKWRAARSAITAFARRPAGHDPAREVGAADAALAQTNVMLTQLLNDSKLILDPDLDSYSAMDAWLLRVPVVLNVATRASSQIAAESDPITRPTSSWRSSCRPYRQISAIHSRPWRRTSHRCEARLMTRRPPLRWARRSPG